MATKVAAMRSAVAIPIIRRCIEARGCMTAPRSEGGSQYIRGEQIALVRLTT
jgi:hypothetical protein